MSTFTLKKNLTWQPGSFNGNVAQMFQGERDAHQRGERSATRVEDHAHANTGPGDGARHKQEKRRRHHRRHRSGAPRASRYTKLRQLTKHVIVCNFVFHCNNNNNNNKRQPFE